MKQHDATTRTARNSAHARESLARSGMKAPDSHEVQARRGLAIGAVAVGALALGAVAIGAMAIGRLTIKSARIRRLEIDELIVHQKSEK